MRPYYQSKGATIYHGDCLEVLPKLKGVVADLILCDPPYGQTIHNWDSAINMDKLWPLYKKVSRPSTPIVLFAIQPFASALVMSNPKDFRYEWIWKKTMATLFQHANRRPMRLHENILVFYKRQPVYNPQFEARKPYTQIKGDRRISGFHSNAIKKAPIIGKETKHPVDVVTFPNPNNKKLHPTEKPLPILSYLVKTYTNEGGLVLDNCMGSGSTLVAALSAGRRAIGIETDEEFCEKAASRIEVLGL